MSKTATHDSAHAAVIVWGFVPATATVAATVTVTDGSMLHSYIHVYLAVVCLLCWIM